MSGACRRHVHGIPRARNGMSWHVLAGDVGAMTRKKLRIGLFLLIFSDHPGNQGPWAANASIRERPASRRLHGEGLQNRYVHIERPQGCGAREIAYCNHSRKSQGLGPDQRERPFIASGEHQGDFCRPNTASETVLCRRIPSIRRRSEPGLDACTLASPECPHRVMGVDAPGE